jgi:hypothetical protein
LVLRVLRQTGKSLTQRRKATKAQRKISGSIRKSQGADALLRVPTMVGRFHAEAAAGAVARAAVIDVQKTFWNFFRANT